MTLAAEASRTVIPLAVFAASLAGSLHCVGMCGGLVVAAAPTPRALVAYQLGRLIGYGGLGALAGIFGAAALRSSTYGGILPWLAAFSIGAAFILLGISLFKPGGTHLRLPLPVSAAYSRLWGAVMRLERGGLLRGGLVGLLSVFLPCGWLYGFVLGAVATQSAWRGALFLSLFWLGTVPAMSVAPRLIQRVFKPIAARVPRLAGALLILIGLSTITMKAAPLIAGPSAPKRASQVEPQHPPDCPMHKKAADQR